jgi:hypothetical protein
VLQAHPPTAESGEHRVDAALSLEGNGIHMDFKIANVNTGWSTIAQIPFEVQ